MEAENDRFSTSESPDFQELIFGFHVQTSGVKTPLSHRKLKLKLTVAHLGTHKVSPVSLWPGFACLVIGIGETINTERIRGWSHGLQEKTLKHL